MAQFDRVTTWEVDGLAELLAECGMIEGHPLFGKVMKFGTHFCGNTAGVDSVAEMATMQVKGVPVRTMFLKHLNDEFPDFPKIKFDKLRKALAEIREQKGPPKSSKRGRKSKFADDVVITWKTHDNPHRESSARWYMWDAAYGTENRGDFLSKKLGDLNMPGGGFGGLTCWPLYDDEEDEKVDFPNPEERRLKNCGGSTYFNMLVSMGHIEVKN